MPAPGLAKTDKMLLSTATVMLGAVADLHKLNPVEHSIGLVKNVQMSFDPSFVELGQGLANDVVMSVKTADAVRVGFEVYEFTMRNLAYAAGLDGSQLAYDPIPTTYATSVAPSNVTVTCTVAPVGYIAGDFIYIQSGEEDIVHIAKVASVTTTVITLNAAFAIPAGMVFGSVCRVGKVKKMALGGGASQPELACKIVGLLPKDNQPVTLLMPKVKITKGMGISFQSDNFSNMPFELMPYAGLPTDPMYSEYGAAKMVLFPR